MRITWFGHSNFLVEHEAATLLVDPFFAGNPKAPLGADAIKSCDAVLLTHDHGDHLGQAVDICNRTGAQLVGVFDTIRAVTQQGLQEDLGLGMNVGGTVSIGDVRVKMVQAVHSSVTGVPTGYIVTFPDGFCLYHAGDTALFSDMQLFPVFHSIDLALLPIGGWFTMDPEQAAYACKLLECKKVAPMHWGTFPILEQGTESFAAMLAKYAPKTELVVFRPGEPITF